MDFYPDLGHFSEYNLCPKSGSVHIVRSERFHEVWAKPVYDVRETTAKMTSFERVRHSLTNAVDVRMMADCKLGCLLSGGLDSSLICALVKQKMPEWGCNYPLETFAIGITLTLIKNKLNGSIFLTFMTNFANRKQLISQEFKPNPSVRI